MRSTISVLLVAAAALSASAQEITADWIESPEAYFATAGERREWGSTRNAAERTAFRERYWLRRDPTPGTEKNEFREAIEARIQKANEKFRIEETAGSRTARGFVYVVFGPPARVKVEYAAAPTAPRPPALGQIYQPQAVDEFGEKREEWIYDRDRTPRLLEMVGLPSLTLYFMVRPQKKSDELETPGLAYELRDRLAARSIVTDAPVARGGRDEIAVARTDAVLPDSMRRLLEAAEPAPADASKAVFGHAVRWSDSGDPYAVLWFSLPGERPLPAGSRLLGRVVDEQGKEIAAFEERPQETSAFASSGRGHVYAVRLPLPAGNHQLSIAVVDHGGTVLAAGGMPLQVGDPSRFAASSLVLAGEPAAGRSGLFSIRDMAVVPRADARFDRSESLWLFGELRNVSDPQKVSIEIRVRSGARVVGRAQLQLDREPLSPGRYAFGQEIPLASFEPGDYSVYAILSDGSASEVRRADFRLLP